MLLSRFIWCTEGIYDSNIRQICCTNCKFKQIMSSMYMLTQIIWLLQSNMFGSQVSAVWIMKQKYSLKTHWFVISIIFHNPPWLTIPLSKSSSSPYPFTQEEGHHAAHEDNGDHSQSEVQEEGPRGGQRVHPVKFRQFFGSREKPWSQTAQRNNWMCTLTKTKYGTQNMGMWQMIFLFRGNTWKNWWIFDGAKWWNTELSPIKQCSRRVVKINEKMSSVVDPNILKS